MVGCGKKPLMLTACVLLLLPPPLLHPLLSLTKRNSSRGYVNQNKLCHLEHNTSRLRDPCICYPHLPLYRSEVGLIQVALIVLLVPKHEILLIIIGSINGLMVVLL